jgi:hypothetical protein
VPESPSGWDREAGTRLWIRPNERLLWRGGPDPKVNFGPEDRFLIPVSLLWGGLAIFWEIGASRLGWGFGSLWDILFVLIGLCLIVGRLIYKRWIRSHTRYAISDQRIIVPRKAGRLVQSIAALSDLRSHVGVMESMPPCSGSCPVGNPPPGAVPMAERAARSVRTGGT